MHQRRGSAPRSNRRPAEQPPSPVPPSPPSSSSAAYATPVCRAASPGSPPSVPSGSGSSFGLGSPWSGSAPGAELDPAPLRLGVSSGEQVFIDPQNRDAVLVPRRGMQMPSGLRTTTAYTVDVQLANGLCYAVRFRFSRFERLHAELLRELPGVPLPPLPQKRGLPRTVETRHLGSATARHPCLLGLVQQALDGRGGHAAHSPMEGRGTAARLGHCCGFQRQASRPGQVEGHRRQLTVRPACDRAADRLARQLLAPGRSSFLPAACLAVLPLAPSASLPACGSTCSSTHLRQVVAVPRLAASRALQQLLVPPPGQRLIYSDPSREAEGGAEGWPRTPRHAAGEEEEEEGPDAPELQLSRCSSSGGGSGGSGGSGPGGSSRAHHLPLPPTTH